jgi:hypothetical protein
MSDCDGFGIDPVWVSPDQLAAGILQALTNGGEDEEEEDLLAEGGATRAPPGPRRRQISTQRLREQC